MIKILIVDDNASKEGNIKKILYEDSNIPNEYIMTANCTKGAKKLLYKNRFDLMILDLVLPVEEDGEADPKYGIKLLEEIPINPAIKSPIHIVGLSGFSEMVSEYHVQFSKKLWNLIDYEADSYAWQDKLTSIVQHLVKTRQDFLNASVEKKLDSIFSKLEENNHPIVFLGHDWKTICYSLIEIVERIFDVPKHFSNGLKAKNINVDTFKVANEYDFQNLIHLVLRPWLPSIEAENIAVKFDGNTKYADFSINANSIIIEAKHIDTTGKKNDTLKTIEGLSKFYKGNANVKALIFLLLIEETVKIDKYKIEEEFSILNNEPYIFVSIILNKLK